MAKKVVDQKAGMDELMTKLAGLKKEQMNMRFQLTTGQLPKTHVVRKTRREVARVKTQISALNNEAKTKKGA